MYHLHQANVRLLLDVRQRRGVRGPEYVRRYTTEILDYADLTPIATGTGTAALLCVERDPEACHRSLIADRLPVAAVEHLKPL